MSTGPGFVFWGLFLVFAIVVIGYIFWMVKTEKEEKNK